MSDRNELGRQMATKLYAAERALDVALAEIGDLSALMTRGRGRAATPGPRRSTVPGSDFRGGRGEERLASPAVRPSYLVESVSHLDRRLMD